MTEIHHLTALELAASVRRREVSPVDVADHTLERAERLGEQVGAFVTLTPDLAYEQARAAERTLRDVSGSPSAPGQAGELSGRTGERYPLLGVPCPVKDLTRVAGVRCMFGSAVFRDTVADVDDGVVSLLRAAGTLMIGKTNTPEFGLPCYTESLVAPPARTPWDLTRSAGGSSGGAAAAVAAGIVPVAHGSDGGGSIRIPASSCGVVGLKASRGRVSPGPHKVDGSAMAVDGALTRDVRDAAALLDVLSARWPGDTFLLPTPRTTFLDACDREPGRLRVGLLTTPVIAADAPVDQPCLDAVIATARVLEELGHDVDEAPVPFPAHKWASFEAIWSTMALLAELGPEDEDKLVPLTRWLRERGRGVTGVAYATAMAEVQRITRETAVAWAGYDVIVSPTLARLPAAVGELRDDLDPAGDFRGQTAYTPWTSVWNLTGWPSLSLPLHWVDVEDRTLPVGVMLGGRLGSEEMLLSLAAELERARPWRGRIPDVQP